MASSTADCSSTNDMSSTRSESLSSFAQLRSTSRLTKDAIIKECIRQGYYRNPICNEVLYLHHKGFDSVDPTAFDLYIDVKVLWLEGNGFSSLPCGGSLIQVRPPKIDMMFESEEDEAPEEGAVEEGQSSAHHVDPMGDGEHSMAKKSPRYPAADLPDSSSVSPEEKDAFSSLYPTVRQLYLHNNVFRVMPDLSRFQRLDAINLSNNFFPSVRPCCPHWETCMSAHRAEEEAALLSSKSALRARQREETVTEGGEHGETGLATGLEEDLQVVPSEEARVQRESQLLKCSALVEKFCGFCPHEPLHPDLCGKKWRCIPPLQRNPCASLRSLNLSGNHIETFEDLVGLLCYKSLAVLDLSNNQIKDGEMLLLILERMTKLSSLKLSGNPLVRSLRRYRKTVVGRCSHLLHLDDRPVFEEERRTVNAWVAGGDAAEERERLAIKAEKEAKERKRLDDFRRLIARAQRRPSAGHEGYIEAITTREAMAAIALEEGQSSATSSEESDEEEGVGAAALTTAPGLIHTRTTAQAAVMRRHEVELAEHDDEEEEEEEEEVFIPATTSS